MFCPIYFGLTFEWSPNKFGNLTCEETTIVFADTCFVVFWTFFAWDMKCLSKKTVNLECYHIVFFFWSDIKSQMAICHFGSRNFHQTGWSLSGCWSSPLLLASALGGVWLGGFHAHWCVLRIVVRVLLQSLFSPLPSSFTPRPMSLSILPTSTELATLGTLTDVVRWVGINTAIWDSTSRGFGTLPNMRVLACQPPESVLRVINGLRIPILRADGRPGNDSRWIRCRCASPPWFDYGRIDSGGVGLASL